MAREFSRAMNNAADDAGVGDISSTIRSAANPLKSSVDAVKNAATDYATYDPETETGRLAGERAEQAKKIKEHAEKKAKDNLNNEILLVAKGNCGIPEYKNGEVLVSASKAQKIKGWDKLVEAYEKNEPIMGKITSKCKGGCIVEHIDTGSLMFLPGSQISDKPLKDISHLMNEPQKFALIKLDKIRGNACVSRREIISSFKKEDKAKIIEKYKVGDIIKGAEVKRYSTNGISRESSRVHLLMLFFEVSRTSVFRLDHFIAAINRAFEHFLADGMCRADVCS